MREEGKDMDTGCRTDKKEYYEKMMEEIGTHPDFGKRNPVDIGIECGYSEDDVMGMIHFLQGLKGKQEMKTEKGEGREKHYFLLRNHNAAYTGFFRRKREKKRDCYIVSVDINTWSAERIKGVEKPVLFQIKGNIYAWVDQGSRKCLKWENLENGEKGEFHVDSGIKDILVVEDGIVAVIQEFFLLFRFQGEKVTIPLGSTRIRLMEGLDAIYIIFVYRDMDKGSKIWRIEKKNFSIKKIFDMCGVGIAMAEYADGGLVWYAAKPYHGVCRRYLEKSLPDYSNVDEAKYGLTWNGSSCTEGINTRNYKLVQRKIICREDETQICNFYRAMPHDVPEHEGQVIQICGKGFYNGQVTGIYEKDIFIGVTEDDRIIRIDLRDDVTPDTVEITE